MSYVHGYVVTHVREGNHLGSVTEGVQIKLTKDKPTEEHHTHMRAPRKLAQDVASTEFTSCLRRGRERGQHFWKSKPCVGEAEGPTREHLSGCAHLCQRSDGFSLPGAVPM